MLANEVQELRALLSNVGRLRSRLEHAAGSDAARIEAVQKRHRDSALNLVHYAELRRHDIRELQAALSEWGLSSLGRAEPHVMASLDALIRTLTRLVDPEGDPPPEPPRLSDGAERLAWNAVNLLGPAPEEHATRIMVTLPSTAADDPALVQGMIENGMDIARINCAHDAPDAWQRMAAHIRAAEQETGRRCLIAMDLAGPKMRTGPLQPGPEVRRVKPTRSLTGTMMEPGRVWLGEQPLVREEEGGAVATIPLDDPPWAGKLSPGDRIDLVDGSGSRRSLLVEQASDRGCLATLTQTVYFTTGLELKAPAPAWLPGAPPSTVRVGSLPPLTESLRVWRGDSIVLTDDLSPADSTTVGTHRIGCTLPEVLRDVRPGERIYFDDGKIGGVITDVADGAITAEVTVAGAKGSKLAGGKGINLPDSHLSVSALTQQDIADLEHVKQLADIVSMSFVRSPADVRDLLEHLDGGPGLELGIVLKIETVAAFQSLPAILLELMKWSDVGVMIARGDLAVEAGFERLAEVQEEILWLCEAGHVPVIWATQVLDRLARTGMASRAEVTDAAMAERAECVMLNKGPYINDAIIMLAGILRRMQDHTQKKRSLLRRLHAWDDAGRDEAP